MSRYQTSDVLERLKYARANGWKCHGQMVDLMDEAIEKIELLSETLDCTIDVLRQTRDERDYWRKMRTTPLKEE